MCSKAPTAPEKVYSKVEPKYSLSIHGIAHPLLLQTPDSRLQTPCCCVMTHKNQNPCVCGWSSRWTQGGGECCGCCRYICKWLHAATAVGHREAESAAAAAVIYVSGCMQQQLLLLLLLPRRLVCAGPCPSTSSSSSSSSHESISIKEAQHKKAHTTKSEPRCRLFLVFMAPASSPASTSSVPSSTAAITALLPL